MTYFTSDLHLGHENIIRFCNRPFSSFNEMNRTLIDNWNSRVTDRDDVYILGDMFYKATDDIEDILRRLKGRKHLIIGNHDYTWMKKIEMSKYFIDVNNLFVLKEEGRTMALCHYPLLSWPHMEHGGWCIYGHIHNSIPDKIAWDYICQNQRLLNAGVEINGYYPVTFEELINNNELFKDEHRRV